MIHQVNTFNMENKREENPAMIVVAERISALHEDITDMRSDMKESMSKVADAVQMLVRLEVRQEQDRMNYERLNMHLDKVVEKSEKLEARLTALEISEPIQKQTSEWVGKAVWAVVAASAAFAAKSLGFL